MSRDYPSLEKAEVSRHLSEIELRCKVLARGSTDPWADALTTFWLDQHLLALTVTLATREGVGA